MDIYINKYLMMLCTNNSINFNNIVMVQQLLQLRVRCKSLEIQILLLNILHCRQQRPLEGMPMISIGGSFNNRHRQSIQENCDIQLPLIETNRTRVICLFSILLYYVLIDWFSRYQEILCQQKQQNLLMFYRSNVDQILL